MTTPELVQKLRETASLFRQSDPNRAKQLDEAAGRMEELNNISNQSKRK